MDFRALHVERRGEFTLPLPVARAFPLFTPEGERAWIKGWDPVYLHETAFRTTHNDEETLWLILACDLVEARALYGRFTPGSRIGTVEVRCAEESPGHTRVTISYSLTALSPAGNEVLAAMTPAAFAAMLNDWREAIHKALPQLA